MKRLISKLTVLVVAILPMSMSGDSPNSLCGSASRIAVFRWYVVVSHQIPSEL